MRNFQFLQSQRGKTGGYRLIKQPKEINLAELMRLMDGPIAMLPCVSLNYYATCAECDEEHCQIKPVFEKIRNQTLEVLNNTTVESMLKVLL